MRFLLKILLYTIFFLFTVVLFLPKEELYYLLEKKFETKNIIVSNEKILEGINSITLLESQIFYDGLFVSQVENLFLNTYLFFTKVEFRDVKVSKELQNILPSKINAVDIKHNIIDFDKVDILINDDEFLIKGLYLLARNQINFELILKDKNKTNNKLIKYFKKIDGKYYYEYKF